LLDHVIKRFASKDYVTQIYLNKMNISSRFERKNKA